MLTVPQGGLESAQLSVSHHDMAREKKIALQVRENWVEGQCGRDPTQH